MFSWAVSGSTVLGGMVSRYLGDKRGEKGGEGIGTSEAFCYLGNPYRGYQVSEWGNMVGYVGYLSGLKVPSVSGERDGYQNRVHADNRSTTVIPIYATFPSAPPIS